MADEREIHIKIPEEILRGVYANQFDYAEFWREVVERRDVDAVDICTPNASHSEIALAAAQKAAYAEQLAQAKRNFEVGTATIVDTLEAQARYDQAVAKEVLDANDLEVKKRALQQLRRCRRGAVVDDAQRRAAADAVSSSSWITPPSPPASPSSRPAEAGSTPASGRGSSG